MKLATVIPQIFLPVAVASGIYNSSTTPNCLPWNTYNYCNAPHVNPTHYSPPSNVPGAQLVYLNTVIRHHKRTPDNLYPNENALNSESWDCTNFLQYNYALGGSHILHETNIPAWHPFLRGFWNGTCDRGQLTAEGFEDSIKHGRDFFAVYDKKLGFLKDISTKDILIRTSTEPRTFNVAGGFLYGADPTMLAKSFPVVTQPTAIDSIPPSYSCPYADSVRNTYQSVPAWTNHLQENAALKTRLDETLGTAGYSAWASWYDHFFDTFTSRTCNGHSLPCNSTGSCVSEADAAKVFEIGDWEYNYIWNTAENSTLYTQLTFGVFMSEISQNFKLFKSGGETYKLRFYVGHDGTMIRLASLLGFGKREALRWPAEGSEIVMEVWETEQKAYFVRILHEGTVRDDFQWIPLDDFIAMLDSQVIGNLFEVCNQ